MCALIKKSDLKLLRSSHEMREKKKRKQWFKSNFSFDLFAKLESIYIYMWVDANEVKQCQEKSYFKQQTIWKYTNYKEEKQGGFALLYKWVSKRDLNIQELYMK